MAEALAAAAATHDTVVRSEAFVPDAAVSTVAFVSGVEVAYKRAFSGYLMPSFTLTVAVPGGDDTNQLDCLDLLDPTDGIPAAVEGDAGLAALGEATVSNGRMTGSVSVESGGRMFLLEFDVEVIPV